MTDHYELATIIMQRVWAGDDADRTHEQDVRDLLSAQVDATLAVADLIRQGQLDAETKEMFTVHPDDRDRERAEAAEHERVAAAQAAWEAMWTKVYSAINTYCDAEDSDLDAADSARNELADVITNVLTNGGEGERAGAPVEDRGHGTRHNAVMTALAPYDHAGDTTPLSDIADDILTALDRVDSSPRVWSAPPAPGPAVTAVRGRDGDTWRRDGSLWRSMGIGVVTWHELVIGFGPLTEVTEDGAQ